MAEKIDPVRERERLAKRYAAMSDLELQKVGREPEELTEWARQALKEEMEKRGLDWSPDAVSTKMKVILESERIVPLRTYKGRMAALVDRNLLQCVGIKTFFLNEDLANLGGEEGGQIEIKLMVRAEDLRVAKLYLQQKAVLDSAEESEQIENEHVVDELPGQPVILRIYRDMPPAITDRMILKAAGIHCYLYDENIVRLDWLWSNLLGGIKLMVRQSDAEEAEKLLNGSANEKFVVAGVGEYEQERCPKCNSMDDFCDELKKRIAGAGLLLGIPIAMVQRGWNCHSCGHTWEVAEEQTTDQIEPPNS